MTLKKSTSIMITARLRPRWARKPVRLPCISSPARLSAGQCVQRRQAAQRSA
jgi:hypothetical protein